MLGLLVHGDNHFIVNGVSPPRHIALELVRHWSIIQIGAVTPAHLAPWRIVNRAFREDLAWAVIVASGRDISPAVALLLSEITAREIIIQNF